MSRMRSQLCATVALLMLAACAPSAGGPPGSSEAVRAWFDAPLPETVFRPPNPCQIVAHGASPSGIAAFELDINGAVATLASPDSKSSLATLTRDCGLILPGRYALRLRVQDNAGKWSGFAETSLIIEGGLTATPSPAALPPAGPTPTFTPTWTPTPAPAGLPGSASIESISTDLVYAGDKSCGANQVTIVARATSPKPIQVVVLFYRYEPGSPSGFENVAMSPMGKDLYQWTLNPTATLGGAADATLQYQVVVQQTDGDTSIRTPVMSDIAVQACGNAVVDCPSYDKKRACESHGCSWVEVPAIVPLFECRNP